MSFAPARGGGIARARAAAAAAAPVMMTMCGASARAHDDAFVARDGTRAASTSTDVQWWSATGVGGAARAVASFARGETDIARWRAFGDFEHGGSSACAFTLVRDDGEDGRAHASSEGWYARLSGVISSDVPEGASSRLKRSGFAGARTVPFAPTMLNPDPVVDLDAFEALSYRVRGCGRMYIASVRTENWMTGDSTDDVWQAAFTPPANKWVDIVIPLDAFTQTYRGRAMDDHKRMAANRVVTLGVAIAGSAASELRERAKCDGAFALDVHSIVGLRMNEDEIDRNATRIRDATGDSARRPRGGFAALALNLNPNPLL